MCSCSEWQCLFSKGGSPSGDWIPQDWSLAQDKISSPVTHTLSPKMNSITTI